MQLLRWPCLKFTLPALVHKKRPCPCRTKSGSLLSLLQLVDVLCFTWYNIPQYYTQAELLKCTEAIFLSLILRAKLKKITQQKYSALLMTLKRYATNMRYTSSSFPSENSNVLCLGVFAAASISIMEVAGHTRQSMNSVLSISSP